MPIDPDPNAPYWPDIVGSRWPTVEPTFWYGLGSAASQGADALDIGSVDKALSDFAAGVRVSAALDPMKAALLTHRNRLQDFADVLRITAGVFDGFGNVVYDTQHQLYDHYETTLRQVNGIHPADPGDAAQREAAAQRVRTVLERAAAESDGIVRRNQARIDSPEFRGLQVIADLLGADEPWNHPAAGPGGTGNPAGHPAGRTPSGPPKASQNPPDLVRPWLIRAGLGGLATDPTVPIPLPGLRSLIDALGLGNLPDLPGGPNLSGGPGHDPMILPGDHGGGPAGPATDGMPSGGGPSDGGFPGTFGTTVLPPGGTPGSHGVGGPAAGHYGGQGVDPAPADSGGHDFGGGDPSDGFTGAPIGGHRGDDPADQPGAPMSVAGSSLVPHIDSPTTGGGPGTAPGGVPMVNPEAVAAAAMGIPLISAPQAGPAPVVAAETGAAQAVTATPGAGAGHTPPAPGPSSAVPRVSVGMPGHPGPPVAGKPPAVAGRPDPHPGESSADLVRDAVGAAMVAATPAFVLGERVDGDLVLARTLLRSMLAVVDTSPLAPEWAVAALRHAGGVSAFLTSTEGRGWLPAGLYLPREASIPWVWEVALESGWEGVADPARVLVEFGLAWRARSGARLSAVVSSCPMQPGLADLLPGVSLEGEVTAAPELDLTQARPGLVDRLGLVAAPQLLDQVDAIPPERIAARCLELASAAHARMKSLPDALGVAPLRARILAGLRHGRAIPDDWWEELRDADDLLAATALPLLNDVSRVPIRELRSAGRDTAVLRTLLFHRRGNELTLLLAAEPTRQVLRDATYTHAHLTSHPAFERGPVPPAGSGPGASPGARPTITAGPDRR